MADSQLQQLPSNGGEDHGGGQPVQQTKPSRVNDHNAMFLRAARAGQLEQVLDFLKNGIDINTSNSNGLNALHLASKEGHNDVVRELIRRGATVDAATRKGNTALHIASLAGQDIIVTILVENGANVNAQSLNGFTPLYMSAQENHENVVRYLLSHGANQALATEDGFTPLAVALQQGHDRIVALLLENDNNSKIKLPALHIAAKKDDTRAATLLLQNEQNPNVTSKSGFTPLHIAAHYGNESIAELLLEKGANVNFQARHNISPLHVASKWGRVNLASLLLARGAIIDCRTRDLLTPLHCAARSGHDQVVDLLLDKGAPIGAKTKNGLAPLHMAAQGDHVDCARILLYHRAGVDEVTVDYLTALHVAAHCGHVRVAKLLLDRNADPNARALNGFTPLHIACKKNRIKVVELLLKYHASVEASTESGLSPLHVAAFMGCINIVIFLIQHGANVDVETVRGETPLHLAARANQTDIVRVLVRNKANVDAKARELQTPLHIASRLGNTDIVVILLNANANPNAATKDLYTPLHIAAKEGQEEVAVRLLDHNADKSLLTKKGFTPLHLASKYGNYEVAKLLLERKTPVDVQGKNQVTPLHVAAHYNNERVAQLLLEKGASAQATAKNGYTPLHIAAKKNQMDIASALLNYKADPNAESRAGFTPLHLAAEEGHREMAALLVENGSVVNGQAKNGLTPLHLCAQEDRVEVAAELLKNKAEINAQTKAGYAPLHVACHFGQINMVRFLIENGALVSAQTKANYTPLHQAAQQGHNNVVRYLLEHGASPNSKTTSGQTPLSIAQRLGYVSVVETLKTVTETTVITETTTVTEERYNPQNPEAMNETMFSDSEDEVDDHQEATQDHAKDFNESITQGLRDSAVIHLIHTGEQSKSSPFDTNADADLEAVIKRAQNAPVTTAMPDPSFLENGHDDNVAISRDMMIQPSFLISFLVDARGGAMRGCRHSGVRVIVPPRKAAAPMRITCRYLKKEKLSHPPPLSEGEALASRVLEMGPHGAKFLGPVILEVPHFASLRGREREIVILRSDDGQHWKEHQLEATEDAVQEVLNESFDASELQQLDDLHTSRITRILTNDFPMYFAVVTRVRQEVHCVGPEGGLIISSVIPRVQAIFPDGSLTKTIKVSLQAQPVPYEIVAKLHGNRVAVSPIVTVEPRRRKFHKPITLCIPLPQTGGNKGMLTQYNAQTGQEPPTLRLLCSITGGSSPAQWEDITGTTQLTFTGEDVSFTTTVSARFWLMDCQTPRDAARMAQEVYNEAISVPYMAKFVVFSRRPFPIEGQLRLFCMTDDREDKTLEKQEGFTEVAKSRDVEVLSNRHQFLEFAGNLVPVTKSGDQLSVFFLPFQENRLAFNVKIRQGDSEEAASAGRIAIMKEARIRAENIPPQHPICTLTITLPEYIGPLPTLRHSPIGTGAKEDKRPIHVKYSSALAITSPADTEIPLEFVARKIGPDWPRLARTLGVPDSDVRQIKKELSSNGAVGQEPMAILKIWIHLKSTEATVAELQQALRRIGRDDIVQKLNKNETDSQEGDSLRLADSSNLNRSNFSSKGSLLGAATDYSAAAAVTSSPALQSHAAKLSPQPQEQQEEEQTSKVVTRTERYVHSQDGQPIVDERTTTLVYHDNAAVEEQVVERSALPLTAEENQIWREGHAFPELEAKFANSREAMIIDGQEQYLGDGNVLRTTTLISQHVVPQGEDEHQEDAQPVVEEIHEIQPKEEEIGDAEREVQPQEPEVQPQEPEVQSREKEVQSKEEEEIVPSPGPEEPVAHSATSEELVTSTEQLAQEHTAFSETEREQDESPEQMEEQRSTDVSPPVSVDSVIIRGEEEEEETVSSNQPSPIVLEEVHEEEAAQPQSRRSISSEARGYEGEYEEGGDTTTEEGTSPSFDVRAAGKAATGNGHTNEHGSAQPEGSTASSHGGANIQHKESSEETFANGDGSQVVSKKMTRVVTSSQSSVSGADEAGPATNRSIGQAHEVVHGRNGSTASASAAVDETESIASNTSLGSVRDRIAIFESLKESGQPHSSSSRTSKSSSPKSVVQEHVIHVDDTKEHPSLLQQQENVEQEKHEERQPSPVQQTYDSLDEKVSASSQPPENTSIAYALLDSHQLSAVDGAQADLMERKGMEEVPDEEIRQEEAEEYERYTQHSQMLPMHEQKVGGEQQEQQQIDVVHQSEQEGGQQALSPTSSTPSAAEKEEHVKETADQLDDHPIQREGPQNKEPEHYQQQEVITTTTTTTTTTAVHQLPQDGEHYYVEDIYDQEPEQQKLPSPVSSAGNEEGVSVKSPSPISAKEDSEIYQQPESYQEDEEQKVATSKTTNIPDQPQSEEEHVVEELEKEVQAAHSPSPTSNKQSPAEDIQIVQHWIQKREVEIPPHFLEKDEEEHQKYRQDVTTTTPTSAAHQTLSQGVVEPAYLQHHEEEGVEKEPSPHPTPVEELFEGQVSQLEQKQTAYGDTGQVDPEPKDEHSQSYLSEQQSPDIEDSRVQREQEHPSQIEKEKIQEEQYWEYQPQLIPPKRSVGEIEKDEHLEELAPQYTRYQEGVESELEGQREAQKTDVSPNRRSGATEQQEEQKIVAASPVSRHSSTSEQDRQIMGSSHEEVQATTYPETHLHEERVFEVSQQEEDYGDQEDLKQQDLVHKLSGEREEHLEQEQYSSQPQQEKRDWSDEEEKPAEYVTRGEELEESPKTPPKDISIAFGMVESNEVSTPVSQAELRQVTEIWNQEEEEVEEGMSETHPQQHEHRQENAEEQLSYTQSPDFNEEQETHARFRREDRESAPSPDEHFRRFSGSPASLIREEMITTEVELPAAAATAPPQPIELWVERREIDTTPPVQPEETDFVEVRSAEASYDLHEQDDKHRGGSPIDLENASPPPKDYRENTRIQEEQEIVAEYPKTSSPTMETEHKDQELREEHWREELEEGLASPPPTPEEKFVGSVEQYVVITPASPEKLWRDDDEEEKVVESFSYQEPEKQEQEEVADLHSYQQEPTQQQVHQKLDQEDVLATIPTAEEAWREKEEEVVKSYEHNQPLQQEEEAIAADFQKEIIASEKDNSSPSIVEEEHEEDLIASSTPTYAQVGERQWHREDSLTQSYHPSYEASGAEEQKEEDWQVSQSPPAKDEQHRQHELLRSPGSEGEVVEPAEVELVVESTGWDSPMHPEPDVDFFVQHKVEEEWRREVPEKEDSVLEHTSQIEKEGLVITGSHNEESEKEPLIQDRNVSTPQTPPAVNMEEKLQTEEHQDIWSSIPYKLGEKEEEFVESSHHGPTPRAESLQTEQVVESHFQKQDSEEEYEQKPQKGDSPPQTPSALTPQKKHDFIEQGYPEEQTPQNREEELVESHFHEQGLEEKSESYQKSPSPPTSPVSWHTEEHDKQLIEQSYPMEQQQQTSTEEENDEELLEGSHHSPSIAEIPQSQNQPLSDLHGEETQMQERSFSPPQAPTLHHTTEKQHLIEPSYPVKPKEEHYQQLIEQSYPMEQQQETSSPTEEENDEELLEGSHHSPSIAEIPQSRNQPVSNLHGEETQMQERSFSPPQAPTLHHKKEEQQDLIDPSHPVQPKEELVESYFHQQKSDEEEGHKSRRSATPPPTPRSSYSAEEQEAEKVVEQIFAPYQQEWDEQENAKYRQKEEEEKKQSPPSSPRQIISETEDLVGSQEVRLGEQEELAGAVLAGAHTLPTHLDHTTTTQATHFVELMEMPMVNVYVAPLTDKGHVVDNIDQEMIEESPKEGESPSPFVEMMGQEPQPQAEDKLIEREEGIVIEERASPEENASGWSFDTQTTVIEGGGGSSRQEDQSSQPATGPSTPVKENRKTRSLYDQSHYSDTRLDRPEYGQQEVVGEEEETHMERSKQTFEPETHGHELGKEELHTEFESEERHGDKYELETKETSKKETLLEEEEGAEHSLEVEQSMDVADNWSQSQQEESKNEQQRDYSPSSSPILAVEVRKSPEISPKDVASPSPFVEMMGQDPEPLDLVEEKQDPAQEHSDYEEESTQRIAQDQERKSPSESPQFEQPTEVQVQHKRESSPSALEEYQEVGEQEQEKHVYPQQDLYLEQQQEKITVDQSRSRESPTSSIPSQEQEDLVHSTSYTQDLAQEHQDLRATEKYISHQEEEHEQTQSSTQSDQHPIKEESATENSPEEDVNQLGENQQPLSLGEQQEGSITRIVSSGSCTPQVIISSEWVVHQPEDEEEETTYTFSHPHTTDKAEKESEIEDQEGDASVQESQQKIPAQEDVEEEYVVDSSEVDFDTQDELNIDPSHPPQHKQDGEQDYSSHPSERTPSPEYLQEPEPAVEEDVLHIPNTSLPPNYEEVESHESTEPPTAHTKQYEEGEVVESEEVVQEPVLRSPSPPLRSHADSNQQEEEEDLIETESPALSPLPTQDVGDRDNIFDVSSPTPPPMEQGEEKVSKNQLSPQHHQVTLQDVYGTNMPPLPSPLLQSHSAAPIWNKDDYEEEEEQEDYELVENQDIEIQQREEEKAESPPQNREEEDFYMVEDKDLPPSREDLPQRQPSEDIIQYKAAELVQQVLENITIPTEEPMQVSRRETQEDEEDEEMIKLTPIRPHPIRPHPITMNPSNQLGLQVSEELFRPKSPVPPAFSQTIQTLDSPEEERKGSSDSINIENNSSGSNSSVNSLRKHKHMATTAADNISEGSLQEFERIEQELGVHRRGSSSAALTEEEVAAASAAQNTGSQNSLNEFENLEKEVREAVGAIAEDVMLLSDIREESDEAEEMSTREDEEDEEDEQDSLSGHPPVVQNLDREHLDTLGYGQDAMLSSVDSLDVARHAAGHALMDTSMDSLEAGSLPRHIREQSDETSGGVEPVSQMQVSSQDTGMSAGTDTTFQEDYGDDKDSLDGVVHAYPTTLTTFETVQMKEDGSTETITRRVITHVTDPVHSRVRFTGTESEDQLRNIHEQQPIESVDEEGNITTIIRRQTIQ